MIPSSVPQDAEFLTAVWSIQLETYNNIAVSALWTYDLMLRLQEEAAFLIEARWNVAKFFYIVARYMPFLMASFGLAFEHVHHTRRVDCQILGHLATAFSMITIFCSESIFVLRTCAMWNVKSYLGYIIFGVMIGITFAALIIFHNSPGKYTFVPEVPPCKALQIKKEPGLLWLLFIIFFMFELVFVVLTVVRVAKSHRETQRPLRTLLLTHHTFHYGCGFLFSVVKILCVALLEFEYSVSFFNAQITMRALFATRMQYQLWEFDRARRSYHAEQHSMMLLFLYPTEETVMP